MSAVIRYSAPGWPVNQPGHSAFAPNFNRHAASSAYQYKDRVTGQPGTMGIPVVPVVPSPDVGDIALMGLSRSGDAPNMFYPNLYYARPERMFWPGAGMPVSVQSDNLLPVPAADPRGIPSTQYFPIVQRGQQQIGTAPNMPRWPWRNRTG